MRVGLRSPLILIGALTLLACPEQNAVWVEDGSTPTNLTFGVGRYRDGRGPPLGQLLLFAVRQCLVGDEREVLVWEILREDSLPPIPTRIRYGEPPPGYTTRVRPQDLVPGCYEAFLLGSGRARFEVGRDGTISAV
jgi:hypothetical protein